MRESASESEREKEIERERDREREREREGENAWSLKASSDFDLLYPFKKISKTFFS